MNDSATGRPPEGETSTKPYMVRALYEWCCDNGYTPYLAVSVDERTVVPRQYVKGGEIVLNVSPTATSRLSMGNDRIEFQARFGGVAQQLSIPVANVSAIYARETGHGMAFEVSRVPPMAQPTGAAPDVADDGAAPPTGAPSGGADASGPQGASGRRRSHLSDVSAKGGREPERGVDGAGSDAQAPAGGDDAKGEVIAFKAPAARRPRRGGAGNRPASAPKSGARSGESTGSIDEVAGADAGAEAGAGAGDPPAAGDAATRGTASSDGTPGASPDDDPGGPGGGGGTRRKAQLTRVK